MTRPRVRVVAEAKPWGYIVTAKRGRTEVARLEARLYVAGSSEPLAQVHYVVTSPDLRRSGVATRLYEAAARLACADGRRLASDYIRSPEAQAFWEKQVRKGRAVCMRRAKRKPEYDLRRGGCEFYALKSCDISDLSGRRR